MHCLLSRFSVKRRLFNSRCQGLQMKPSACRMCSRALPMTQAYKQPPLAGADSRENDNCMLLCFLNPLQGAEISWWGYEGCLTHLSAPSKKLHSPGFLGCGEKAQLIYLFQPGLCLLYSIGAPFGNCYRAVGVWW